MAIPCVLVPILKLKRKQADFFQASFLEQPLRGKDFQLVPHSSLVAGFGFRLSTMTLEHWFWALKITLSVVGSCRNVPVI